MMEVETALAKGETATINIVNLQGFEMVPGDSLEAAHPPPIVCLTQGARPVSAAPPQRSTNQYFCIFVCVSAHKLHI